MIDRTLKHYRIIRALGAGGMGEVYLAATLTSAEAQLGGPTVVARDARPVRNLLYAFDGCFDTM